MALLQVNTFSQALSRIITFHIILPNDAPPEMLAGNSNYDRPMKTLYLLHGFSGSTQDWLTGSLIQELALKYNLAVVMPAGENSFYLNGKGTGRGYETFTAVELPARRHSDCQISRKTTLSVDCPWVDLEQFIQH